MNTADFLRLTLQLFDLYELIDPNDADELRRVVAAGEYTAQQGATEAIAAIRAHIINDNGE